MNRGPRRFEGRRRVGIRRLKKRVERRRKTAKPKQLSSP